MKIFNHIPMNFSIDKWQYIFCYNWSYFILIVLYKNSISPTQYFF